MVHCAVAENAELVIVSRDSDFGAVFEDKVYVNDHLRQEFSERVSHKRKLLLLTRLSEALKHFAIAVTPQEVEAEAEFEKGKIVSDVSRGESRFAKLIEIFERASSGKSNVATADD